MNKCVSGKAISIRMFMDRAALHIQFTGTLSVNTEIFSQVFR